MKMKGNIRQDVTQYTILLGVLLMVALLSSNWFFRLDLTSEKRYTLSAPTKQMLRSLDGVIYFRIYLDGDLPPEFVRFQVAIREMLDEFRAYGGEDIQYEFINLYDEPDQDARTRMIAELYAKGLQVTSIQMKDDEGGRTEKIIFPGAMVSYRGVEFPVNLLKNNPALPHEANLSNSIQSLEYEFARAVHSLTLKEIPKIAFIEGQGELDSLQTFSLMDELKNFFQVDRGFINGNTEVLKDYAAIIIAKPQFPFSEADKYAIDQYIMHGGKVLWFLDPVISTPDSLSNGMTIALANPVGVEDLLFKYGVRIEYNIAADLQCSYVPVNTAVEGQKTDFVMKPWVYFPLFTAYPDHMITRGLNYIQGQFVSVLDTLSDGSGNVKKTVLLKTSETSKLFRVPLRISVDEVAREPNPRMFTDMYLPTAVLLEGSFPSFYTNYGVPKGVTPPGVQTKVQSEPTSMLVVTDGDIIRNEVSFRGGRYVPEKLGYDQYTRQTFGNLEFVMNAISYMTDQSGLMELRSREFKLRLLNKAILSDQGKVTTWKIINAVIPAVLVMLTGFLFYILRKRRYTR